MLNVQVSFLSKIAADAVSSLKRTWKFWLGLTAKFLGVIAIIMLLGGMVALILGKVLCAAQGVSSADSWFEGLQKLQGIPFAFYCGFVIALCCVFWWSMWQWSFVSIANSLDVAQNKNPRGFVYMKNIVSYAPALILLILVSCIRYTGSSYCLWALYLVYVLVVKSYIVGARLCLSIYAFLDQRCTARQSLAISWDLTSRKRKLMIAFALILFSYHCLLILFPVVAMAIGFLSVLFFPLFVLFYAHMYVALKNIHSA